MYKILRIILYFFFLGGFIFHANSQTHSSNQKEKVTAHHLNHMALFIGQTTQYNKGNHYLSFGLDYMRFYKRNENWGASGFIEGINGEHFQWVFGVGLVHKPFKRFVLKIGPGIELVKQKRNDKVEIIGKMLIRLGVSYEFHIKRFTVAPIVSIDYIRNHPSLVYGINFGFGF